MSATLVPRSWPALVHLSARGVAHRGADGRPVFNGTARISELHNVSFMAVTIGTRREFEGRTGNEREDKESGKLF